MATATLARDDNVSRTTEAPEISPQTLLDPMQHEKSNGHIPPPLRSAQRVGSLGVDDMPDVPRKEPGSIEPNDSRVEDGSFPFTAQPGATGPAPTTAELLDGQAKENEHPAKDLVDRNDHVPETIERPERRSVQFAAEAAGEEPGPLTNTTTLETDEGGGEAPPKDRQARLLGKLRAFASSSSASPHVRNTSTLTSSASPTVAMSPQSERSQPIYPVEPNEEAEADVEDDSDDVATDLETRKKQKRKRARPRVQTAETAPSVPKMSRLEHRFASFMRDQSTANESKASPSGRAGSLSRRNTTSDASDNARAGVSEDEGRDRVRNAWRRGIEGARGLSYHPRPKNESESPSAKRPNQLRRITGLGESATSGSPFRTREKPDRQTTTSAQKWRQVKAGIKLLGQRKRDERMRVDHQKSALLMAELLAGSPAALVLASMFQRDENDHKRIPVLLEQLKIRIPHAQVRGEKDGDRHLIFKIDLEYGNGPARMQWTIWRTLGDFVGMHGRYQRDAAKEKVRHLRSENRAKAKMPKFPKSAFPYGRSIRGLFDEMQEEEEEDEAPPNPGLALIGMGESPTTPGPVMTPIMSGATSFPQTSGVGTSSAEGSARHIRRKSSTFTPLAPRRSSTNEMGPLPNDPDQLTERQLEIYQRRQRRKLETYLQQMIRWLIFRPDSTRLCIFLEISALAIRLSAEGGYQGKQGLLTIASRRNKELSMNKRFELAAFKDRHHRRWFLVRHSYIVCVDGPESLNPYDVFLVDVDFTTEKRKKRISDQSTTEDKAKTLVDKAMEAPKHTSNHVLLRLYNSERKLKLLADGGRQYWQFKESIDLMAEATVWSKPKRFDSYAPVRNNVWCRWLVDGRDHMWQVSRAIDNAKDFVYIHDWWLTPELYMRRPAAISQKWRLDRLLQRKAQEGVKIFVIIYRNIESAIPIDSEYTKWSLLDLHPNICIQRSPNQFRQNQFFWAHHEKTVVVDNMMAFVGGIDLCFGRWDDPSHTLTDDKLTGFETDHVGPRDSEHCQMWPGKDYSNPRVQDYYALDRPYEEMYDRTKVPRSPWHDISMQIVGQPARDVARHFVQRWNYVLRSRIPSRPTPVLLPPPEYEQMELESLGMTGTCQVQILRSVGSWSIGTPNRVEHSIMNAYVHLIEHSERFVYMENQFFITSCTVEGTTIHNKIGDALVERIIRAHENEERWQACIIIPLMPGFQNSVDSQDGTSIRLIMQCQFRSICRGETSIFGRCRARGIDPEEYIRFYALRQWGKIGPRKCLTTEQLYVHAKCMVVDDRSVIIGSANVNERSMLGPRDSEVAAIVTDTKMIPSYMGGEPYAVGEFAHSLRKRLMREHLGIDVDAVYRREQAERERQEQDAEMARIYREAAPAPQDYFSIPNGVSEHSIPLTQRNLESKSMGGASNGVAGTTRVGSTVSLDQPHDRDKKTTMELEHDRDVEGLGFDNMKALAQEGNARLLDSFVDSRGRETMLKKDNPDIQRVKGLEQEERTSVANEDWIEKAPTKRPPYPTERMDTYNLGLLPRFQLPELPTLDDTDIGGPPLTRESVANNTKVPPLAHTLRRPEVHDDCMIDPLISGFYHDIWHQVAENNTKIYRQVFRCMPDSEVLDWKTYAQYNEYLERFMQSQGLGSSKPNPTKEAPDKTGPPGSGEADARSASVVSDKPTAGRTRSKSVLSGFVDRFRAGSKASDEPTHTQEANEKNDLTEKPSESPVVSTGPTAVPSPQPEPLDEKEAQKLADQAQVGPKDHAKPPTDDEKDALREEDDDEAPRRRTVQYSDKINLAPETTATQSMPTSAGVQHSNSQKRRRRGTTKSSARTVPDEVLPKDQAEVLLHMIQGNLVLWPYNWLEKEEKNGNWLYNMDELAPLEIYD